MAPRCRGRIELTPAIVVTIQTDPASAFSVCVRTCEQAKKRKRGDNEPNFRHRCLRDHATWQLVLNTTDVRVDLRQGRQLRLPGSVFLSVSILTRSTDGTAVAGSAAVHVNCDAASEPSSGPKAGYRAYDCMRIRCLVASQIELVHDARDDRSHQSGRSKHWIKKDTAAQAWQASFRSNWPIGPV